MLTVVEQIDFILIGITLKATVFHSIAGIVRPKICLMSNYCQLLSLFAISNNIPNTIALIFGHLTVVEIALNLATAEAM